MPDLLSQILAAEQARTQQENPWYQGEAGLQGQKYLNPNASVGSNLAAALIQGLTGGVMHGIGNTTFNSAMTRKGEDLMNVLAQQDPLAAALSSKTWSPYAGYVELDQVQRQREAIDEQRRANTSFQNQLATSLIADQLMRGRMITKQELANSLGDIPENAMESTLPGWSTSAAGAGPRIAAAAQPSVEQQQAATPETAMQGGEMAQSPGASLLTPGQLSQRGLDRLASDPRMTLQKLPIAERDAITKNGRALTRANAIITANSKGVTKPNNMMLDTIARTDTANLLIERYANLWRNIREESSTIKSGIAGSTPLWMDVGAKEKDLAAQAAMTAPDLARIIIGGARVPEQLIKDIQAVLPKYYEASGSGERKLRNLTVDMQYADTVRRSAFGLAPPMTAELRAEFVRRGANPTLIQYEPLIVENALTNQAQPVELPTNNAIQLPQTEQQAVPDIFTDPMTKIQYRVIKGPDGQPIGKQRM